MHNNYFSNLLCSALLSLIGLLLSYSSYGQVTGTVFKDFNINGAKDNTATFNEVGISGVQVIATKSDGSPLTVTYTGSGTATNGTGGYAITGGTLGQVRLEFIMPDDYTFASNGASGGTTVMFPSTATQNLAVNYPADYCGVTDPLLVTSCYVGNNAAGVNDVLVKYAYSSAGAAHSPSHTTIALANQIGSTYGLGYDRTNQTIYAGAFLKRHIPLKDNNSDGKEDLGAIYKIPVSGSPSLWLDVTTLGIDVGMSLMPTIATRALPIPATTSDLAASHDTQVFPLVGKIGLGDIDISDDNSQLFFVNLNDSKIYTVDLATKTLVGSGIAVPSICTGGDSRPFALAYHRGKLYVGAVCDAATSKVDADMKATVYRLDGTTFTSILSFPLNYTKGAAFKDGGNSYGTKWNPWEDSFSNVFGFTSSSGLKALSEPQPIFADLLFDTDESLIIVLNDRLGHQTGTANFQPGTSDNNLYYGVAAGDLLRASLIAGVYTLEKNGSSGGITTAGAGNGQGPGTPTGTGYTSPSGEFYVGDDENGVHEEVIAGGAALVPGRGQVAVQVSDPAANYFAGGTYRFNNTTGEFDQAYVVFIDPSFGNQPWLFGKANGLGDLEVLCNNAPIEIGNRVWNDLDSDGIQDAGETGIAGVSVSLCTGTGTLIATATTDAGGNYYFSSGSGTSTASALYGLAALTAKTAYTLKFPTTSSGKSLVTPNASADNIDSDAPATGVISFSTAGFGANDHTFDVGYGAAPCSLTVTATGGLCASATNQYTASGTISLTNNTAGGIATIIDGTKSTTVSVAASATSVAYSLNGLTSGTGSHTVVVSLPSCGTATATYSAPASCTVAPVQLAVVVATPICNSATNTYTATGTVSLTNATAGSLTITDNGTTVAVVSVTVGQTSASFSASGISGSSPASHTVIASLGTATTTTTYATPASCTVCTINLTTTSLPSGQVGTSYSQTLTTTGGTTPYTYTVSAGTLPAGLSLNPTTGVISGTPTAAATSSFTIKVTDSKSCTDVAALSITTSAQPVCSLVATATPGTCNSATNTYTVTGTVSATNAAGTQSLTIAVGSINTTVTITGNGPVSYTLTGLTSDGLAKTVSVTSSATTCGSASANFTAPASCTLCTLSLTTTSLPKGEVGVPYSQTITATGGTPPLSFAVSAGTLPAGLTLSPTTGVLSGTPTVSGSFPLTIVITDAKNCSVSAPFTTFQIDPATQRAIAVVVNSPVCNPATNTYTATGTISLTNTLASSLTITNNGTIVTVISVTAGQTSASFSVTGLSNGPALRLVTATLGTLVASTTYTTPASCTNCTAPVVVASAASSTVSEGQAATLTASATPVGSFTYAWSAPVDITLLAANTATITTAALPAGVHTFTVTVTNQGGCSTTATVCVSVPFTACQGSNYAFELSAPAGYAIYEWRYSAPGSATSKVVQSNSTASFTATQPGEYLVVATKSGVSSCPDGSCCPLIITELIAPVAPSLTVIAASCNSQTAAAANNDAQIILSGTALTGLSYNIVKGSSFTAAAPLFATNKPLPTTVGSVLASGLTNPTAASGDTYTVRIVSASGCFTDVVVTLAPTSCSCPPAKCVPVMVRIVKRGRP